LVASDSAWFVYFSSSVFIDWIWPQWVLVTVYSFSSVPKREKSVRFEVFKYCLRNLSQRRRNAGNASLK
jgi:hypothetical protein